MHASRPLNRRQFLSRSAIGAGLGVAVAGCAPAAEPDVAHPAFPQGVASGDPSPTSVVIWTRVAPGSLGASGTPVRWVMSRDETLVAPAADGVVTASGSSGGTVRVVVDGLEPGTTYYYGWRLDDGSSSPVGRTRTAPGAGAERVRFAVASCSNYGYGRFHNYRAIAERDDLDVVVHLGDYIYEYASEGFGETYGTARPLDPPHEIITLDDYRRRYAWYRSDPDLQELHRRHPMIHVWDDHEFADDPFVGGAANHQPDRDGPWNDRVAAALRAYGEWMPTRLDGNRIFRTLDYGDLVRFVCVDRQRRYLWSDPLDGDLYLGREQFAWLDDRLAESNAKWVVLVQQTTFGSTSKDQVSGGWGHRDRERVYAALDRSGTTNFAVLTGDIHRAHALDLPRIPGAYTRDDPSTSAGVELSTGSITSPGGDAAYGCEQMLWNLGACRTFLVVDVTADRLHADWYGHEDLWKYLPVVPPIVRYASFESADGSRHLRQVAAAAD